MIKYNAIYLIILAGVIDEDYRGVIKVVLFNLSDQDFEVRRGDRIAQLICERIYYPEIEEVKVYNPFSWFYRKCKYNFLFQDLNETDRGEGGFGSTGKN